MTDGFDYIDFGQGLVVVAMGLYVISAGLAVGGSAIKDRRWVDGARNAMICSGFAVLGAAGCLVSAFFRGEYGIKYVYSYSERALAPQFKFSGLWAGLDGSLLFWAMLVGFVAMIVSFQFRSDREHPVGRRMEPWVYFVFAIVQIFFLSVVTFAANPFDAFTPEELLQRFPGGQPTDGNGLNPLLQNYWMAIHPPTLYFGWVIYTVPFAFGVAALILGEQGSYWVRRVRLWMMIGWLFNTSGMIMGGLWAYEVLGWGGIWAWDPVENASSLPFFTATAFLHSIMVQERRDMMKVWNALLVILTFFLSIFGTFLTRSGIVSSVHAFANGDVLWFFVIFLLIIGLGGVFLVCLRAPSLSSRNRIESIFSREAAFILNNMILVAICAGILALTLVPFFSRKILGQSITLQVPFFNMVLNPFWILLLFLTAIGPGLAWISTSAKSMRRNWAAAAVAALPLAALFQGLAYWTRIRGDDPTLEPMSLLQHIYPTAIVTYFSSLILTSLAFEIWRSAANRSRRLRIGRLAALEKMFLTNNRRYGGYLVHVGIAVFAIGMVNFCMYKVISEQKLHLGETVQLGPYEITMQNEEQNPEHPVYALQQIELLVEENGQGIVTLLPAKHAHRNGNKQVTTEVSFHRRLLEDVYVFFDATEGEEYLFTFHRNPLFGLIYLGWFLIMAGAVFAALPLGRKRVGLAD